MEQIVRLDGINLVTSVLELDHVSGFGKSRPSAEKQLDYSAAETLPRLVETSHTPMEQVDTIFRIVVWLDDQTSGFAPFPLVTARSARPLPVEANP